MAVVVEGSSDGAFEAQHQKNSGESSFQLPNVFVTPPEEEFDSPPWCCFDADRDAQPGAFVHEAFENQDFDYAAHAVDEIFGRGATHLTAENGEKEDVFVMRSLMQEAEHLRERLKSLDLSVGSFSFTAPLPSEDDELYDEPIANPLTPTNACTTPQPDEKIKRRKSLFSFRPMTRRKSFDENAPTVPFPSTSTSDLGGLTSNDSDMDAVSIPITASRKPSFFSRFKFSKKATADSNPESRRSISACRSHEDLSSTLEQDITLKRRFSYFGRRASFSSQHEMLSSSAAPSIMPSMNQSSSSLSTSSVPPTPDVGTCNLDSPLPSPTKLGDRVPSVDASLMSSMDAFAIDNIAASLTFPSSHTIVPGGQFSLDPLHFESLQFNSDDFA